MDDFISEDALQTFEGWLRYQAVDVSAASAAELDVWRRLFEDICRRRATAPKVGLMKFQHVRGEYRYAVALRDGADLWLTLWVRRSLSGQFFIMLPRADRDWYPHTSYHLDGTLHMKSFGSKVGTKARGRHGGSSRAGSRADAVSVGADRHPTDLPRRHALGRNHGRVVELKRSVLPPCASSDQRGVGQIDWIRTPKTSKTAPHRRPSRTRTACGSLAAMSLLTELDAFYTEHRRCGELEAGVDGPVVWIGCECARIARRADAGELSRPTIPAWTADASC